MRGKQIPKFDTVVHVQFRGLADSCPLSKTRANLLERYSHLGESFINAYIDKINENDCSDETKKTHVYEFKKFLRFLSIETSPISLKIRKQILASQFSDIDCDDAQHIESTFGKHIRKIHKNNILSASKHILSANKIFKTMFEAKLWPYTLRLHPIKVPAGTEKSKLSLLESLIENSGKKPDGLLTDSERDLVIKEALKFLGIEFNADEVNLTPLIVRGEKECLKRIRDELSKQIEEHYLVRSTAQKLLEEVDEISKSKIKEWFDFYRSYKQYGPHAKRYGMAKELFWGNHKGLNNYLMAIKLFYFNGEKSIIHEYSKAEATAVAFYLRQIKTSYFNDSLTQNFPKIKHLRNLLEDFFCPSPDLIIKTVLLLMSETGMNRAPSIILQKSMVVPDEEPGWLSIASWKDRANGSLIYENIYLSKEGEKISSGTAIKKLIHAHESANYAIPVPTKFEDLIFYSFIGFISEGEPRYASLTSDYVTPVFNEIVKTAFGQYAKLVPGALRVSILTIERAASGNIGTATLKASHKNIDTTNSHYGGRYGHLFRLENIASIRDFQNGMQAIALENKSGGDHKSIEDLVIRTGLGTLCMQRINKAEDDGTCTSIEDCPNCASLKISTHPDDLADLLEWSSVLHKEKTVILSRKGDAWENKWIFWTQLVDEILEIGPRSPWAKSLHAAKEILKTRPTKNFPAFW